MLKLQYIVRKGMSTYMNDLKTVGFFFLAHSYTHYHVIPSFNDSYKNGDSTICGMDGKYCGRTTDGY